MTFDHIPPTKCHVTSDGQYGGKFLPPEPQNEIIYVLDSVGYNEFTLAKTPNIDTLGPTYPAYAHSYFTPPSIEAMFRGALPQPTHCSYWPFGIYQEYGPMVIIPMSLSDRGWNTYLLSSNLLIGKITKASHDTLAWNDYFDHYNTENHKIKSSPDLVRWFLKNLEEPFYAFFLLIETHEPYFGIDSNQSSQIQAIEFCDESFKTLLDGLRSKNLQYTTRIHVTSDHSEAWDDVTGENNSHSPVSWSQYIKRGYLERLLTVPIVWGIL